MSLHVMVSADFPGADSEKRKRIAECLKDKNWEKIEGVTTTWCGVFTDSKITKALAKQYTVQNFSDCASPGRVKLAIQIGDEKPISFP